MPSAYCCNCIGDVEYRVINGDEYYNGFQYHDIKLAQCTECGNVTTLYSNEKVVIPNQRIREIRHEIHSLMSPYWKNYKIKNSFYVYMSQKLGYNFHCGELKDEKEAVKAYNYAETFVKNLKENGNADKR